MPDHDPHNQAARLAGAEARLQASQACAQDLPVLLQFRDQLFVDGLGTARIVKYLVHLRILYQLSGASLMDLDPPGAVRLLASIQRSSWKPWTKHDYLIVLRRYLQHVGRPDLAQLVKLPKVRTQKLPEELLTPSDVRALLAAARTTADRALISLLYETGARISEILTMQYRHCQFDPAGCLLILTGKTGMRRVRIRESVEYLDAWILETQPKPTDRIFAWQYPAARKRISVLARRADIPKRIYPHLFRHSRATFLAAHLTQAQLCQYLGWTQGSDMARIYIHLSSADLDPVLARLPRVLHPERQPCEQLPARL